MNIEIMAEEATTIACHNCFGEGENSKHFPRIIFLFLDVIEKMRLIKPRLH